MNKITPSEYDRILMDCDDQSFVIDEQNHYIIARPDCIDNITNLFNHLGVKHITEDYKWFSGDETKKFIFNPRQDNFKNNFPHYYYVHFSVDDINYEAVRAMTSTNVEVNFNHLTEILKNATVINIKN